MNGSLPVWKVVDREDLGGGFLHLRGVAGQSAIVATSLGESGVVGLMSSSGTNARDEAELRAWIEECGLPGAARVRRVTQVHGTRVVGAHEAREDGGTEADGLRVSEPNEVAAVTAADCAPVWIVDSQNRQAALVHAGWRGVAGGVVGEGIAALRERGSEPASLALAIGPHLGPCCFEVGPEVAARFDRAPGAVLPSGGLKVKRRRDDSSALDLAAAIVAAAAGAGASRGSMRVSSACTRCRADILHSYRRNGPGGPLMVALGLVRS